MNYRVLISLLLLICFSISAAKASEDVSIYALLSDSADIYDGDILFTEGYLCINPKETLLYPTRDACKNNLYTMAIKIETDNDLYNKREVNGHLAPVEVVGKFRKRDPQLTTGRHVALRVIENSFIARKDFYSKKIHSVSANEALLKTVNTWLDAVQSKSLKKVSKLMGVPVESLQEGRVQWLLFEYAGSVKKILENNPDINIIQYKALDEFESTFICITSQQDNSYSYVEELPEIGDDVSKFCFEAFTSGEDWIINPGYFGVR